MRTEEREALRARRIATIRRMAEAGADVGEIKAAMSGIGRDAWTRLRNGMAAQGVHPAARHGVRT